MCNDYAREIEIGRVIRLMKDMDGGEPAWPGRSVPNDIEPKPHIKIKDRGFIVRKDGPRLMCEMMTWAWAGPRGKPVFNFVSEKRDFSKSDRCLILATGFYEYTQPYRPNVKLKDQHLFTLKDHAWFWIAAVIKQDAFAMLTTAPGPDMQPYHDRQVIVLPPAAGQRWLDLTAPLPDAPPARTFQVRTLRRDGVMITARAT